jgi:murein DD-endopeptidase MepM/ murein hydrolase activator NlpD
VGVYRGVLVTALLAALTIVTAVPAAAAPLPLPDPKPKERVVDLYPEQMPASGIAGQYGPAAGGFLTLPYLGDGHFVTSAFDHCGPNYRVDGVICRFDGTVAYAGNGRDPEAPIGYAMTSGKQDWLFYDGHDGWDLGLYYEQVVAAADGVVSYADWSTPGCTTCSFGQGVRIDHGNGFDTLYGHLWKIGVQRGQSVRRGQVIGISGSSGASTGEHLHFGVYHHGTWDPVDPFGWEGGGRDPWPDDAGNLWLNGAARSPALALPKVTASATVADDGSTLQLSWSSPGPEVGFDVTQFVNDEMGAKILSGTSRTSATVPAEAGHSYWFEVTATTSLGESDTGATAPVTVFGAGSPNR